MGELIILRHGETQWSKLLKHTGRTDLPLTPHGEDQARALAPLAGKYDVVKTFVSPALRARRTAELAAVPSPERIEDLWEWDYGRFEGLTTKVIRETIPGWSVWDNGTEPGETPGESADEVGARVDRVIALAKTYLPDGDVALVAHGHVLRVLTARWLGLAADQGRLFALDTGTSSTLGFEHDRPVIRSWNVPA